MSPLKILLRLSKKKEATKAPLGVGGVREEVKGESKYALLIIYRQKSKNLPK